MPDRFGGRVLAIEPELRTLMLHVHCFLLPWQWKGVGSTSGKALRALRRHAPPCFANRTHDAPNCWITQFDGTTLYINSEACKQGLPGRAGMDGFTTHAHVTTSLDCLHQALRRTLLFANSWNW